MILAQPRDDVPTGRDGGGLGCQPFLAVDLAVEMLGVLAVLIVAVARSPPAVRSLLDRLAQFARDQLVNNKRDIIGSMWTVLYLPEAERERRALPAAEKAALINADRKLHALGPQLPYPHSTAVKGAVRLRELRPRGGRSTWRALYRQVGDAFVVAVVAPEAQVNGRKFDAACRAAERRLAQIEEA